MRIAGLLALLIFLAGCGRSSGPGDEARLTLLSPPDGAQVPAGSRVLLAARLDGTDDPAEFAMQGVPRGLLAGPDVRATILAGTRPGETGLIALRSGTASVTSRMTVGPPGAPRAFQVEAFSPQLEGPDGAAAEGPLGVLFSDAPAPASVQAELHVVDPPPGAPRTVLLRASPTPVPELWLFWPQSPLSPGRVHRAVLRAARGSDGAALAAFSSDFPVARPRPGPVCGWVVDKNLRPIPGVAVEAAHTVSVTDAQGFFRIDEVPAGATILQMRRGAGKPVVTVRAVNRGSPSPTYLPWPVMLDAGGAVIAQARGTGGPGPVRLLEPSTGARIHGAAVWLDGRWHPPAVDATLAPPGPVLATPPGAPRRRSAQAVVATIDGAYEAIPVELAPGADGTLEGTLKRTPALTGPWHAFSQPSRPAVYWPAAADARLHALTSHATRRLAAAGWLAEGEGGNPLATVRALARLQALMFLDGNGDRTDGLVRLPAKPLEPLGTLGPSTIAALDRALPQPALKRLGELPPLPRIGLERALPLPPTPAHLVALSHLEEVELVRAPVAAGPALAAIQAPADRVAVVPLPEAIVRVRLTAQAAAPRSPPAVSSGWRLAQLASTAQALRSTLVEESSPQTGDALVPCDVAAWARLRTSVDSARLALEAIQLFELSPVLAGEPRAGAPGGTPVPVAVCLLPDGRTLIARPARPLAPWTTHVLVVRGGVLGATGALATDSAVTFSTGPAAPPPLDAASATLDLTGTPAQPSPGAEWFAPREAGAAWIAVRLAAGAVRWLDARAVTRGGGVATLTPAWAPSVAPLPSPAPASPSPAGAPLDLANLKNLMEATAAPPSAAPAAAPSVPALWDTGESPAMTDRVQKGPGLTARRPGPAVDAPTAEKLEDGFHVPIDGLTPQIARAVRGVEITIEGRELDVQAFSISAVDGLTLHADLKDVAPATLMMVKLVLDPSIPLRLPAGFQVRFAVKMPDIKVARAKPPEAVDLYPTAWPTTVLLFALILVGLSIRRVRLAPLRLERGWNWLAIAMLAHLAFGLPHLWLGSFGAWLPAGAMLFGALAGAGVRPYAPAARAGVLPALRGGALEMLAGPIAYLIGMMMHHGAAAWSALDHHGAFFAYPERGLSLTAGLSLTGASQASNVAVVAAMALTAGFAWVTKKLELKVPICPGCGKEPEPRLVFSALSLVADGLWRSIEEERWRTVLAMRSELLSPEATAPGSAFQVVLYDCSACSFARVEMRPPRGEASSGLRSREWNGDAARAAIAHVRTLGNEVSSRAARSRS